MWVIILVFIMIFIYPTMDYEIPEIEKE